MVYLINHTPERDRVLLKSATSLVASLPVDFIGFRKLLFKLSDVFPSKMY